MEGGADLWLRLACLTASFDGNRNELWQSGDEDAEDCEQRLKQ